MQTDIIPFESVQRKRHKVTLHLSANVESHLFAVVCVCACGAVGANATVAPVNARECFAWRWRRKCSERIYVYAAAFISIPTDRGTAHRVSRALLTNLSKVIHTLAKRGLISIINIGCVVCLAFDHNIAHCFGQLCIV